MERGCFGNLDIKVNFVIGVSFLWGKDKRWKMAEMVETGRNSQKWAVKVEERVDLSDIVACAELTKVILSVCWLSIVFLGCI